MRWLIVTLALAACDPDGISSTVCDEPCYSGPPHTLGVGDCRSGRPICDHGGRLASCDGAVEPVAEICDGHDNDCDGVVDDVPRLGAECEDVPTCWGHLTCDQVSGGLVCVVDRPLTEETCDGVDNDCNWQIDDVEPALCFGFDPALLRYGVCRAGLTKCEGGVETCSGAQGPVAEICGNGIDDDCDGLVDESEHVPPAVDIAFHVDLSTSMDEELPVEKQAIVHLLLELEFSDVQIAVIRIPGSVSGSPEMLTDFIRPRDAVDLVTGLRVDPWFVEEPIYDSLWMAAGALSWRSGSRQIHVFFGDEAGQSQRGRTQVSAAQVLVQKKQVFYGFIDPEYAADYDILARKTGGELYALADVLLDLEKILSEDVIGGRCGE